MPIVKQLRVSIENRVGTLAELTKTLASAGINIQALLAGPGGSAGYVDLLVLANLARFDLDSLATDARRSARGLQHRPVFARRWRARW